MTNQSLIVPTFSNNSDLDFLVLTLTPEDVQTLDRLHDVHLALAASVNDVLDQEARIAGKFSEFSVFLGWTSLCPDWHDYPESESLQEALSEALEDHNITALPEPPAGLPEPAWTESDALHVDYEGFWFTTYRRHGEEEVKSYPIPWNTARLKPC